MFEHMYPLLLHFRWQCCNLWPIR